MPLMPVGRSVGPVVEPSTRILPRNRPSSVGQAADDHCRTRGSYARALSGWTVRCGWLQVARFTNKMRLSGA